MAFTAVAPANLRRMIHAHLWKDPFGTKLMKIYILMNLCAYFLYPNLCGCFVVLWDFPLAYILNFLEGAIVALLFERVC